MLKMSKEYVDQMVAHSLEKDPNECCGILSGADGVIQCLYRITNTANSPYRYLMDPQEFLNADRDTESNGWEFQVFYHSHTHSSAYPSATDVRMALQSGYLMVYYILISLEDKSSPEVHMFQISESGEIKEVKFEVVDSGS
ncbi:M67 family metallopeptidase [Dehalococcoidia bacterium]|jgi:proteasome lid subunit RPN8/RPN11|nr:M67 family metallopeptidase [Dehalococcoidia bacterium]